ncbi:tyrosine-type recombinase/integrase [Plantactinospora solaniradicis]|uniref:Tyrosine-type recombinase/integrase n=1 Tax=Plantactinospora solaniradicis TaxID=1723736 RepID=A0ABW1K9T5_9ACTN
MWIEKHGAGFRIRDRVADRKVTVSDGFPTKTQARAAMKVLVGDQARGDLVMPASGALSLGEWTVEWWDARKSGLAPNTQRSEWSRIKTHIIPELGDASLVSITPLAVQQFVSRLGKRRSAKTVHNVHGVLHTIMAGAVAERLVRVNPCAGTRLPRGTAQEMKFLTEPEAQRLVLAVPEHYRPLVVTALGTGLRWAELAGLRVGRVDVLAATLRVEETMSELAGAAELVFGPPKSARSRRTVSLPSEVQQALIGLTANRKPDELVFRTTTGQPMRVRNFRRVWLAAVARAGVEGLRFHDLRHTHVAWLISGKATLTAIQHRLGHASITVTSDRYGHLLPAVDAQIVDVLNEALPRSDWGQDGGSESTPTHDNPPQDTATTSVNGTETP